MTSPKKAAAAAVLAVVLLCGYEGLSTVAYRDASPKEIWTYCYGETQGVTKESKATPAECKALLAKRVEGDYQPGVQRCITRDMPYKVEAAFISTAYNIGVPAFCRSSIARLWNAGDLVGSCKAILKYVYSGDKILRGLVVRRQGESGLCLEGLA